MANPINRVAAYEDLFDLPDNVVGEIFNGELVTHPRPSPRHSRAASMVGVLLGGSFDFKAIGDDNGWWILDEPECHPGADIIVPDIAGWRKATLPDLPETAWFAVRPDWVCEVVSAATAKYDRGVKREIYAREGVPHYWIVDPAARVIEVLSLENGIWVQAALVADDQVVNIVPFESLPFDLSVLWA